MRRCYHNIGYKEAARRCDRISFVFGCVTFAAELALAYYVFAVM